MMQICQNYSACAAFKPEGNFPALVSHMEISHVHLRAGMIFRNSVSL